MTHLCVSIFVTSIEQAQSDIARAAELGADMVELRVDSLTQPVELSDPLLPYIITCRPTWEGGSSDLSDDLRLNLIDELTDFKTTYVDIELETYRRRPDVADFAHYPRRLIISAHDFQGRPRISSLLVEMTERQGNVNKLVWMARSIRDNLEAFEILQNRQRPTIALCMGEAGLVSRVLAKKFGAFLTFAALDKSSGTAPGQIAVEDMKKLYRWDAINANTRVYGVVAKPVMHSMSPAIHNAAFDQTGFDGVYLPMLVDESYESFKAFMESFLHFEGLHLSGLSITIPHKENALRYLQEKGAEIEELAVRIGAVNTIIVDRPSSLPSPGVPGEREQGHRAAAPSLGFPEEGGGEGIRLRGMNTDYAAILDSITTKLGITREQLKDYRVAVLGAGGTGRTAAAALAHYGATVVVYNRTMERAEALAQEFNGNTGKVVAARMEKLCDSCCHIFINTTSVGMYPSVGESPLGNAPPKFTSDTLVFDTIYNPMRTKLLEQAEAAGAKTIGGIEMFVRQAAAQFEAWTRLSAPRDVMRRVIENRLQSAAR